MVSAGLQQLPQGTTGPGLRLAQQHGVPAVVRALIAFKGRHLCRDSLTMSDHNAGPDFSENADVPTLEMQSLTAISEKEHLFSEIRVRFSPRPCPETEALVLLLSFYENQRENIE